MKVYILMASNREYSYGDDWAYKGYVSKVAADKVLKEFKDAIDKLIFDQVSSRDRARERIKDIRPVDYNLSASIYKEEMDKVFMPDLPRKDGNMADHFWVEEVEIEE